MVLERLAAAAGASGPRAQARARRERLRHADDPVRSGRAGGLGDRAVQPGLLRPAVLVDAGDDPPHRHLPEEHGGGGSRTGGLWRGHGRRRLRTTRRLPPGPWLRLLSRVRTRRVPPRRRFRDDLPGRSPHRAACGSPSMSLVMLCGLALLSVQLPDAPYEETPPEIVEKMLRLADLHPGDVVYDLGCGDGRIVLAAVR